MNHPASSAATDAPYGRLWFALFAPPTAWAVNEMACAVVTTEVCNHGHPGVSRLLLGVLSLVALGFCVAGLWLGLAAWHRVAEHGSILRSEGRSRAEMMSLGGAALGLVFTLATIWNGLPVVLVSNLCAGRQ